MSTVSCPSYKLFESAFASTRPPLILGVDTRLESPETLAIQYEEAARAATGSGGDHGGHRRSPPPPLTMAAYGKPQPSLHMHAFNDPTQSYTDSAYPQYPQSYPEPQRQSYPDPRGENTSQINQDSFTVNNALPPRPFLPLPTPSLLSYAPDSGSYGTRVHVRLSSDYDLGNYTMSILFGSFLAATKVRNVTPGAGQDVDGLVYALVCEAPDVGDTGCNGNTVPAALVIDDDEGQEMARLTLGEFDYTNDGASTVAGGGSSPTIGVGAAGVEVTRKDHGNSRPPSAGLAGHSDVSHKHETQLPGLSGVGAITSTSSHHGHITADHDTNPYDYPGASPHSSHSPYGAHFPTSSNMMATYRSTSSYGEQQQYGRPAHVSNSSLRSPTAAWSPYGPPPDSGRPSTMMHTALSRPGHCQMPPSSPRTPALVRTSTIQGSSANLGGSSGNYGQYPTVYPNKAELKIIGKLEDMAYDWTTEEAENKRRIVQFHKTQRGATITAKFNAVSVNDRPPNSTCVSCIWWAERKECFVTSVDTISLLEALVQTMPPRFSVEEKNRIRRNLEGFHPLTVSKSKPESETFFKTIMNFGNPKPRNIEKDVKVFPWRTLGAALIKIISKYSAKPASMQTVSHTNPLLNPISAPQYLLPAPPNPATSGYAYHHPPAHAHVASLTLHPTSVRSMANPGTGWVPYSSTVPAASASYPPASSAVSRIMSPTPATSAATTSALLRTNSPMRLPTALPNISGYALPMPGLLTGASVVGTPPLSQSAGNTPSTATTSRWEGFDGYHHQPSHAHIHHHGAGVYGNAGYGDASRP